MQLRIISRLGKLIRPVPIAWIVVLLAIIYSLCYCTFTEKSGLNKEDYDSITFTGKLTAKTPDEKGGTKSIKVGDILCYVNGYDNKMPSIGDIVTINGSYVNTSEQRNPAGFDELHYYLARKVTGIVFASNIYVVENNPNVILEGIYKLRAWMTMRVNKFCPLSSGTIITMVVGNKAGLLGELSTLLSSVGLIHILTVSGYHLTLIMTSVYMLISLSGIHKRWVSMLTMVFVIFYSILAGMSVSLLRAMIMSLIKLFSDIVKRSYNTFSALCLAGAITLFISPYYILDSSFLFSYGSLFSIVLFTVTFRGKRKSVKKAVLFAVFMMLMLIPLQLINNARATILSWAVNLLVGVVLAPFLVICIFSLIFAMLGLGFLAGMGDFLCYTLCKLISGISSVFSCRRAFTIYGLPNALTVSVYYFGMIALMVFIKQRRLSRQMILMLAASMLMTISFVSTGVSITAVDVGQGDCFVIKRGKTSGIMIDAGSLKNPDVYKDCIAPTLYANGITTLTDVYITHPDEDHANAILALMEDKAYSDIKIKRILLPRSTYASYSQIIETAIRNNVPVMLVDDYGIIEYENFKMTMLFPFEEGLLNDGNADSMNLLFSYGKFDMLFTGDSTMDTEKKLLEKYGDLRKLTVDGQIELLKIAHHGSRYSNSREFIEALSPKAAIISAGYHNAYGHPHRDVLERLSSLNIKIYSTAQNGAVSVDLTWFDGPSSLIFIKTMIN